jgi:murein tripeptide amidase MpaA
MYSTAAQIESAMFFAATLLGNIFSRNRLPETSVEGRDIHALRLHAGASASRRPVLIVGGTHARELMNPEAIMYLAIDLARSYLDNAPITYGGRTWSSTDVKLILASLDIWFVPCANPDGREYVMTVDSLWRKNRRPSPDPASPTCDGVDLNRNADFVWGALRGQTSCSPCAITYCGPSAFSEPESRNIKHLLDTQRFVAFLDVHSYSELVMYPWGHAPTQTTDPTQRFTALTTGTCAFSIPSSYAEYMPPGDQGRFKTVGTRIADDIQAVRGRRYKVGSIFEILYGATGTQSDYAYSRHIRNPARQKTYGFSFETGPVVMKANDASKVDEEESFHPANPEPILEEIKAGILSLLEQSVCALDYVSTSVSPDIDWLRELSRIRDEEMSPSRAGREWIELYERVQFPLLSIVTRKPTLARQATALFTVAREALASGKAGFTDDLLRRAARLLRGITSKVTDKTLKKDLLTLERVLATARGRTLAALVKDLTRHGPAAFAGKRKGRLRSASKR